MKTAGDVAFEPDIGKIESLTTSIYAMTAGDVDFQTEIFNDLRADINAKLHENPARWLDVGFVAELYLYYKNNARTKKINSLLLAPFGLTLATFLDRQKSMSDGFVQHLSEQIAMFRTPDIASIICGLDNSGSHIYVIDDTGVNCKDKMGFASIGIGRRHADSQMMNGGHTAESQPEESLLLVYAAKKRAEVSPGVGAATDMFSIGNQLGVSFPVPEPVISKLDEAYVKMKQSEKEALNAGFQVVRNFFDEAQQKKPDTSKQTLGQT